MLIVGINRLKIGKLKRSLHNKFATKELGQAWHMLCMLIEWNPTTMTLRLSDRDSPSTEEERKLNVKIPYTSAIGSIMYAMVANRPDLTHVVGVVSWYMSNPGRKHWEAINHIPRYMRGTKDALWTFGSANLSKVKGYTNSDYVGNANNWKSTSNSPMAVVPYHGGRSYRSAQPCCRIRVYNGRIHTIPSTI